MNAKTTFTDTYILTCGTKPAAVINSKDGYLEPLLRKAVAEDMALDTDEDLHIDDFYIEDNPVSFNAATEGLTESYTLTPVTFYS